MDRNPAAVTNNASHPSADMWLMKLVSSVPASTPRDARIGRSDKAMAISAAEAISASPTQTIRPRLKSGLRQIRPIIGLASAFNILSPKTAFFSQ